MPAPIDYTKNKEFQVHHTSGRYSGIQFVDDKQIDPNGSQTPKDRSFSIWQNSWKTFIKIFQTNIFASAGGNISLNAGEDFHVTGHNKQETTSGGSAFYNKGETTHNHGEMTDDEKAKMKEYHGYLDQITQKAQDAIKNTPGEKVDCPNCAQQHLLDDKSDQWVVILDYVRRVVDNFPYLTFPFAVLRTLIMKVYVPLLGQKSNIGLNGGKGCGPGCEAGTKEGMSLKMQAGEQAVKDEMTRLSDSMNKLTASLKNSSATAKVHKDSEIHIYGDPTAGPPKTKPYIEAGPHHSLPMNLRVSDTYRNKMRVTTEGNCKVVVYQPPLHSPFGNLMMQIQNNLKITTGNAGMDLMSTGEIQIKGGSLHMNASEGELSMTSKNLTTIGGANVLIAADNKSGDTGVCIDSKHTYVRGAFNVNGDTAMLGALSIDGPLSVPYINCPTMAAPSTLNGTSKFASHHANWEEFGTAINALCFEKDLITKFLFQPSLLLTGSGLTEIIMEAYNLIMMALFIEILPTGIFIGGGVGLGVTACAGLVWNFTHNHTEAPGDHTHETAVPKGGSWKTLAGAGQQRVAGNPAPTPAPTSGTWPSPGPRSQGGGCGGGGLFQKVRNQKYGIDNEDAFNGGNFVTTTAVRNPDGSLYPPPDLTHRVVTDTGIPPLSAKIPVVDPGDGHIITTTINTTSAVDCID